MAALFEAFDERDHFGDVARGARHDVWTRAAERIEIFPQRCDVFRRVLVNRHAVLLRERDDAIFNVRDVHHVRDMVALEAQVAAQDVREDVGTKVTDVAVIPDSRPAEVHPHLAFCERAKLFKLAGKCVVKF